LILSLPFITAQKLYRLVTRRPKERLLQMTIRYPFYMRLAIITFPYFAIKDTRKKVGDEQFFNLRYSNYSLLKTDTKKTTGPRILG